MNAVEQARARADDAWDDALLVLRADLAGALAVFREQCAPVVGPEVTCRGVVVCSPRSVPVDPRARVRYSARLVSARWREVALEVQESMSRVREAFAHLAAWAAGPGARDDFALMDETLGGADR